MEETKERPHAHNCLAHFWMAEFLGLSPFAFPSDDALSTTIVREMRRIHRATIEIGDGTVRINGHDIDFGDLILDTSRPVHDSFIAAVEAILQ